MPDREPLLSSFEIDIDHFAETLIELGETLPDNDVTVQNIEATEKAATGDPILVELSLSYEVPRDRTHLTKPIRYREDGSNVGGGADV